MSESALISDLIVEIGASDTENMVYFGTLFRQFIIFSRIGDKISRCEYLTFVLIGT